MYKRYMVFSWTRYDNVEPFQCLDGHTDDLEEARRIAEEVVADADEDGPFACVFDRIQGDLIKI